MLNRYVDHLRTTVNLLARFHIYTILDMHQDVYSEMFEGEGAPDWAVCTNGVPSVDPPGRWSLEYGTRAAGIAFSHFWRNNVVGDLQGQYDEVWADVAHAFREDPWVLGFDPFNEPFSTALVHFHGEHFDAQLECFYTGTAQVGTPLHGAPPLHCPKNDPAQGVIPTIESNDPGGAGVRRAGQLRQPRLPDLPRADGSAQPGLQRAHLLRCPQPGHGEPHQPAGLRRAGGALAGGARPPTGRRWPRRRNRVDRPGW